MCSNHLSLSCLIAPFAYAQQPVKPAEIETAQIRKIEVTGSRIPSPTLTSESPVNVINAQDIKYTGLTNTSDIVNQLPQAFADQGNNLANGASGTCRRYWSMPPCWRPFQFSVVARMSPSEPLISVVIPSINRPQLVTAAVDSALRQSLREIEVIVVVDGPDDETLRALREIKDPRLRVLPLRENVGLGGARHAGIDVAQGQWIALLDDDDEWLPQKLEIQLDAAQHSRHRLPIISCRVIARTQNGDVVRPIRCPAEGEALSEYLFCKTHLRGGEGLILPSTILAPIDLLRDVRFRFRNAPFEGSDWLLRALQCEGVGVEFVATREPLAIWHCEETRARISTTRSWRASLAWADSQAALLTPRAHASFILNRVSREARRDGDWSAFWLLPWEAFRRGRPTAISLLAHAIVWLTPRRVRSRIAAFMDRQPDSATPVEDQPNP